MKVYIDSPGSPFDVVVAVRTPDLAPLIAAKSARDAKRIAFADAIGKAVFGKRPSRVRVRFEDECEACGGKKDADANGSYFCHNPACAAGVPPTDVLARLMKEHRPADGGKEPASQWFGRLVKAWKDEWNAKPKPKKKEN